MHPRVAAKGCWLSGRETRGQQEKWEVEACAGRHQHLALVLPAPCQRFKLHEQAPATRKRLMTYGFRTSSKWEKSSLRLHGISRISTALLIARVLQEGWMAEGTASGGCSNLPTSLQVTPGHLSGSGEGWHHPGGVGRVAEKPQGWEPGRNSGPSGSRPSLELKQAIPLLACLCGVALWPHLQCQNEGGALWAKWNEDPKGEEGTASIIQGLNLLCKA